MTFLDELLNRTAISEIIPALGGPKPKRGRCAAWWRGGDNPTALCLDEEKGVYFDNVSGKGGGKLSLIQAATGCDRKGAAEWLARYHGTTLGRTDPAEVRRLADRRRKARERAAALIDWRDRLVLALRDVRNSAWTAARQIEIDTTKADPDDPATWQRIVEAVDRRRVGDAIDEYLNGVVMKMGAGELIELRESLERESR